FGALEKAASIELRGLDAVGDLRSLGRLKEIESLTIISSRFSSLAGLQSVQKITSLLRIEDNPSLVSLDALLNAQLLGSVRILRNAALDPRLAISFARKSDDVVAN